MPNHMAHPAMGAPYSDCIWNVSHKNAPGAISAIAFTVRPVSPNVALEVEDLSPLPEFVFAEDMVVIRLPTSTDCATHGTGASEVRQTP